MRTRVSVGAAALGAAVAATGLAPTAQAEAVHLSYTAPASCPAEAALVDAVVRNGGHLTREAEALPARSFAVSVEEGRGITGRLAVRSLTGEEAVRTIQGTRCEDVVSSLGVLVSLALDPDVASPAEPEPAPTPGVAPEPPASHAAEKDRTTPKDPPGPLPFGWRFGASTEGSLGGLGTDIAAGLAAYVDLVHDVPDWSAFALRVGAEIAASSTGDNRTPNFSGRSGLQRRVLRAELCPARALVRQPWDASTIELWACARLDAGVVQASSGSFAPVDTAWLAPGPKLAVRWVTRHFFFELGGGLMFPLDRRLALDAYGDAYRAPGTLGVFGIGIGWFVL
jgi:hypothetical protein